MWSLQTDVLQFILFLEGFSSVLLSRVQYHRNLMFIICSSSWGRGGGGGGGGGVQGMVVRWR